MGMLDRFMAGLWQNSWQAAVAVFVVLAVQAIWCRGVARRWRAALWGVVLVRLIAPVLPESPWSIFNAGRWVETVRARVKYTEPARERMSEDSAGTVRAGATKAVFRSGSLPPEPGPIAAAPTIDTGGVVRFSWMSIGWAIGAAGLAVAVVRAQLSFRRRLAQAVRVTDSDLVSIVEQCAREMGIGRVPSVWRTDAIESPALAGLLQTRLLIPTEGKCPATNEAWRHVFLHEMAHLKRGDLWIDLFCDLVLAVHWFNPLVWVARARYRADREMARDEMVLNVAGEDATSGYGRTILALLELSPSLCAQTGTVGILEGRRRMRQRLQNVVAFRRRPIRSALLGTLAAVLVGCSTLTDSRGRSARTTPPTTRPAAAFPETFPPSPSMPDLPPDPPTLPVLERRMPEMNFNAVALSDVIDFLRDVSGANIFVNWRELEVAGVKKNVPVTARFRDTKFSAVLNTVLSDAGGGKVRLDWMADEGVISISTADAIDIASVLTRVYDIHDLLTDIPNWEPPRLGGPPSSRPATQPDAAEQPMPYEERVASISKLICETIDPDSWHKYGHIKFHSGQFIVTQARKNHRELIRLLEQIRQTRGIQVMLETHIVIIPPEAMRGIDARLGTPVGDGVRGHLFDPQQAQALFAALVEQPGVKTLASPRLTLFNGQRGYVLTGTDTPYVADVTTSKGKDGRIGYKPRIETVNAGILVDVQATVSSDRHYVTCTLRPKITHVERLETVPFKGPVDADVFGERPVVQRPVTATREMSLTLTIPDGGASLIGGFHDTRSDEAPTTAPASAPGGGTVNALLNGAPPGDVYLITQARIFSIHPPAQSRPGGSGVKPGR